MSFSSPLRWMRTVALGLALAAVAVGAARAEDVADFYRGKRITIIVPSAPGGSYDLYSRVLQRHFTKHMPGNPSVIVQNMPGAGGRRGTAFISNIAPKDGTILGAIHNFMAFDPLFEGPGYEAQFDPRKFNWIGSVTNAISVAVAWHTSPIETYKDLYDKEMVVGGVGTDTLMVTNPYLLSGLLGMKFRVVAGYLSSGEVDLAMQRGEVQGRIDGGWVSVKQCCYDQVKSGQMRVLFQLGLEKHPELPDVPLALDFARNEEERLILETAFLPYEFGRPYITTPELPAERLQALRAAFFATLKDPAFIAEVEKSNMEVNPIQPERLKALVDRAYSLPASLVARINALQKPNDSLKTVDYRSVRATLGAMGDRGKLAINVIGGGGETVTVRGGDTAVTVGGAKAEPAALKPGMTCTLAYLGNGTTAKSVACD
ncbi:MAG: Bug family tripartite tricarboxylate transporter substrate binding protein [Gemmatimonas sp.]